MRLASWDTETALSSLFVRAPRITCFSWSRPDGAGVVHARDPRAKEIVVDLIQNHVSVGVNLAYDFACTLALWPELVSIIFEAYAQGRVLDLRLAQKLHDISEGMHEHPRFIVGGAPYSLEALTKRHLNRILDKDESIRLHYDELYDVPIHMWNERQREYPIEDARAGYDVALAMLGKYGETAWGECARKSRHAFALQLITCWGFRTDLPLVAAIKAKTKGELDAIASRLLAAGLLRRERKGLVRNTNAAKDRMLAAGGKRLTKTGFERAQKGLPAPLEKYICCDAEACADANDPLLNDYAEYQSLGKRLSGQIPHLERGQVHIKFEALRETARTSSGGTERLADGTELPGYNGQNLPRGDDDPGERECFIARPGYVLIDNDFDGLELRTGSQMCIDQYGRSEMAEVLNRGDDVHLDFGGSLLGLSYAEALARKNDPEVKGARQVAKPCNFGLAGGMGPDRLRATAKRDYKLIIAPEKAIEYHAKWRNRWRVFHSHFQWAQGLTRGNRRARIKLLRVNMWRGGLGYCDVANTPFQALGAFAALDSLWEVTRSCYDPARNSCLLGSHPVNFVHDQILNETPLDGAHECALEQTRLMVETASAYVPDVPATTTPTLSARWSKNAKTLYDAHDRLLVWEHEAFTT